MTRNIFISLLVCSIPTGLFAQSAPPAKANPMPPIIDIHVHSMKMGNTPRPDMCLWFLENMPGADPKYSADFSFRKTDCVDPIKAATSDEDLLKQYMETLERLNITAVTFGNTEVLYSWKNAAPNRIIPGIGVSKASDISVKAMRDSLSSGYYKVMSECAPQYQGISPSDTSLDAYFAIAEELDIPVGIHMGTGGNGSTNIRGTKFRASMGNPFELEDLLHRHPKLRVWVQHAAYPMIDELIAVMGWNAYVFTDISGFIWSYPQEEVHMVIKRLVQAGFGKRIMYGTDFMGYPRMVEASIGLIQNASYLTEEQKRDILYNNAARFLRIKEIDMK